MTRIFDNIVNALFVLLCYCFASDNPVAMNMMPRMEERKLDDSFSSSALILSNIDDILQPVIDYGGDSMKLLNYIVSDTVEDGFIKIHLYKDFTCSEGVGVNNDNDITNNKYLSFVRRNHKIDSEGFGKRNIDILLIINDPALLKTSPIFKVDTTGTAPSAKIEFCISFRIFNNDVSIDDGTTAIELKSLEMLIAADIIDDGNGYSFVGVTAMPKNGPYKSNNNNVNPSLLNVQSFECDHLNNNITSTVAKERGSKTRICIRPTGKSFIKGVRIRSINSFKFIRNGVEQFAIKNGAEANELTNLYCDEGSVICSFETNLLSSFYRTDGNVNGKGEVLLSYIDNYFRKEIGSIAGVEQTDFDHHLTTNKSLTNSHSIDDSTKLTSSPIIDSYTNLPNISSTKSPIIDKFASPISPNATYIENPLMNSPSEKKSYESSNPSKVGSKTMSPSIDNPVSLTASESSSTDISRVDVYPSLVSPSTPSTDSPQTNRPTNFSIQNTALLPTPNAAPVNTPISNVPLGTTTISPTILYPEMSSNMCPSKLIGQSDTKINVIGDPVNIISYGFSTVSFNISQKFTATFANTDVYIHYVSVAGEEKCDIHESAQPREIFDKTIAASCTNEGTAMVTVTVYDELYETIANKFIPPYICNAPQNVQVGDNKVMYYFRLPCECNNGERQLDTMRHQLTESMLSVGSVSFEFNFNVITSIVTNNEDSGNDSEQQQQQMKEEQQKSKRPILVHLLMMIVAIAIFLMLLKARFFSKLALLLSNGSSTGEDNLSPPVLEYNTNGDVV